MKVMKNNKFNLMISLLILFAYSCANIQAPSGGPPDKTPPVVETISPLNKTLNFAESKIILQFDKYMNKNSVTENIYILPSAKMKFDWSGKKLAINFDNLKIRN